MGIECTLVPGDDLADVRAAIRPNTVALYTETIGNPAGTVADLEAWAVLAHAHGLPLIVDNTFATPLLCRPIEWGADIVVQSATKFLSGHGTVIGGVIVESGTFPWGAKHPLLAQPSPGYHDMNFAETFGEYAYLMRARVEVMRDVGACLSPMNAWLLLQGVETLPLRMPAHVANARTIAAYLQGRDEVAWVNYAELPEHPSHALHAQISAAGRGLDLHVRPARRPRGRARVHRSARAVEPSRERRRREEPRDPSRLDDAPAAQRRTARSLRRHAGDGAALRRPRRYRRPDLGSRARRSRAAAAAARVGA